MLTSKLRLPHQYIGEVTHLYRPMARNRAIIVAPSIHSWWRMSKRPNAALKLPCLAVIRLATSTAIYNARPFQTIVSMPTSPQNVSPEKLPVKSVTNASTYSQQPKTNPSIMNKESRKTWKLQRHEEKFITENPALDWSLITTCQYSSDWILNRSYATRTLSQK